MSPSALESFSLVVIEAWVDRVPVVVNGTCGPTREHCEHRVEGCGSRRTPSSTSVLDRLLADGDLRSALGEPGRAYVETHFQWPVLISRYAEFLESVVALGRGTRGLF